MKKNSDLPFMKHNASVFLFLFAILSTSCSVNNPDPEPADFITGKAVGAGNSSTVVVHEDGTVEAFGYYALSNLSAVTGVTAVSIGHRNMLLWKDDGSVLELTTSYNMNQVPNLTGITAVAAGYLYSLALKQDGTVWAWGMNNYGQLGDNTYVYKPSPVQIETLADVIAVSTGFTHAVALKADGTALYGRGEAMPTVN
jgi:alpha-tubulin suppressor-like RCC1 family protein